MFSLIYLFDDIFLATYWTILISITLIAFDPFEYLPLYKWCLMMLVFIIYFGFLTGLLHPRGFQYVFLQLPSRLPFMVLLSVILHLLVGLIFIGFGLVSVRSMVLRYSFIKISKSKCLHLKIPTADPLIILVSMIELCCCMQWSLYCIITFSCSVVASLYLINLAQPPTGSVVMIFVS